MDVVDNVAADYDGTLPVTTDMQRVNVVPTEGRCIAVITADTAFGTFDELHLHPAIDDETGKRCQCCCLGGGGGWLCRPTAEAVK